MPIVSKEELVEKIKSFIGENDSDEALSILEDVSDTYTDFEERTKDQTDWKEKYEQNDKDWRQKYRDRFNGKTNTDVETVTIPDDTPKRLNYDDLFKKE